MHEWYLSVGDERQAVLSELAAFRYGYQRLTFAETVASDDRQELLSKVSICDPVNIDDFIFGRVC